MTMPPPFSVPAADGVPPVGPALRPLRGIRSIPLGNAVIWQAPDGVVWLYYVTRHGELWDSSRITAKISAMELGTWSESFQITFEPGTMVRNRPILVGNGDYLPPVYHEVGNDPRALTGLHLVLHALGPSDGYLTESNASAPAWAISSLHQR